MKHFWKSISLWSIALIAAVFFAACSDDINEEPVVVDTLFNITVESCGATDAYFAVETENITRFGYIINEAENDVETSHELIFATGKVMKVTSPSMTFTITGLSPKTDYVVNFAAECKEGNNTAFFGDVKKVKFTTGDTEDYVTISNIGYDSFDVVIKVPESIQEKGNALKYGTTDYYIYNMYPGTDAQKINLHDEAYKTVIKRDTVLHINNTSRFVEGNPTAYICENIVPYQPTYFIIGEFGYVDEDNLGWEDEEGIYHDNTDGFHVPGYWTAQFNWDAYNSAGGYAPQSPDWGKSPYEVQQLTDESEFWTGFYRKYFFHLKQPEKLDGSFDVDLSDLQCDGGLISVTPSENISFWLYTILDEATFDSLGGNSEDQATFQAFVTTYYFAYNYYQDYGVGAGMFDASWPLMGDITPGEKYKMILIGMGMNEDGSDNVGKQCMYTYDIVFPEPKLDAPTIEVTAIERPEDQEAVTPYQIWFNIKCPSKDAETARYLLNTKRAWDGIGSLTVENMMETYGNYFYAEEMEQINSDKGLDFVFNVNPGTTYGLACQVINCESTPSRTVYLESTSIDEIFGEKVESPLYEELQGEWTMTVNTRYTLYDRHTITYHTYEGIKTSKVTIGKSVEWPETLSEDIYSAFEASWLNSMTREELDQLYAELLAEYDNYYERMSKRNYIPCNGFDVYPVIDYLGYSSAIYLSPYDLFLNGALNKYEIYGATELFYDFGPKWQFEVHADGSLTVPFNANFMEPMCGVRSYYMVGFNSQDEENNQSTMTGGDNYENGHFPVEISEDKNTITIKPIEYEGSLYYPQCCSWSGVSFEAQGLVISDIVLTRGWSEPEQGEQPEQAAKVLDLKQESMRTIKLNTPAGTKVNQHKPKSFTYFE